MTLKMLNPLVLLAVGVICTGCGWKSTESWDNAAVWSDDGVAALGVYRFYESKDTLTHTKMRNMESAVHYYPDVRRGSPPRLILPRAAGWARPLYLMKSQGYAIVHRQEKLPELDDGMNETANYTAYKVTLDGGVTSLGARRALSMISCDAEGQSATTTGDVLTVIPSPDGEVLAKLEMSTTCQGKTGELTFLDAESLRALGDPIDLGRVSDADMIINRAWSEEGRFMIAETSFMGPRGNSYAPDTPPADIGDIPYSCYYPETVSGFVNAQGETIENVEGALRVDPAVDTVAVFGCQDL